MLGRAFDFIFTPEDRDRGVPSEELEVARREGKAVDKRWHLRKDGRLFWANGMVSALYDRAGHPDGFVKITRDLTREREAEERLRALNETLEQRVAERTAALEARSREMQARNEALRQSEARFSQAFYASPIPVCLTTVGVERFLQVNGAFTQLTGYTQEEVAGRTNHELGMWASDEDRRQLEAASQGGEGFRDLELHVRTKGGEVRDILGSGAHIQVDGEVLWLKLFYDVTERKRNEEQLYGAIQEVMSDTAWFSQQVMARLAQIRAGEHDAAPMLSLTTRERQVLGLVARGLSNAQIAEELGLAQQTVRNYIALLYDKLGVGSRAEAVVWARERGIVG